MEIGLFVVTTLVLLALVTKGYRVWRKQRRRRYINSYTLPPRLAKSVTKTYPQLTAEQALYAVESMREYFHVCNEANNRMVAMPSQVVDVAWHEFILFTREYNTFCHSALGRFLHHTPTEAMPSKDAATQGLKTAWRVSCYREKIDPQNPHKLPVLFAIDKELGIADGFMYSLDCEKDGQSGHCASHINCGSGCMGSSGDSSCGSDCGGGCGGGD